MLNVGLEIKRLPFFLVSLLLVMGSLIAAGAGNREQPAWLQQARDEARHDGYALITAPELKALYDSGKDFTVIDVRPEYEYRDGQLPQANSLEFDLGDKLELTPEKEAALIKLLGPDKERMTVIYCRSFA